MKDILIACVDGLTGFPEAIAFSKTEVKLCVVHQIRQSLRYVGSQDQKEFLKDLKKVYQAQSLDLAEQNLLELDDKWEQLSTYFKYDLELRRLIYTTNPNEGFHRQVVNTQSLKVHFHQIWLCLNSYTLHADQRKRDNAR